jgi:FtsP/CotA-like multicopper oxidase with cupredoxin domain
MRQSDQAPNEFPADPAGLTEAAPPAIVELRDADVYRLRLAAVAKRLEATTVRMLAYNGSVPGPSLRVRQGSQVAIPVVNDSDTETTVHWHGVRLENRYDGTPDTQTPIPVGGRFTYHVAFPDPGAYWYHPHIRADYGQESGLYGTIVVTPTEDDYWPPVHRELTVTLDDILIEDGRIAPFYRTDITYAAGGRFGNTMLTRGELHPIWMAQKGEVVRLYFTNTANTRTFNVALDGARMKLVGGDSGHYEHEQLIDQVIIAPSERVVVDACFDRPGQVTLRHHSPDRSYQLATITVTDDAAQPELASRFGELRINPDLTAERQRIAPYLAADPDKTIALVAEMAMPAAGRPGVGPERNARPAPPPIRWEDDMAEMNRASTRATFRWKLVDGATGAEGRPIDWRFRVGERIKIRLVNEAASGRMQHPMHIHGAGRFLILARDEVPEANLVWKDTVLVLTGQTVDILLDITNPGVWMVHCHIAEHDEAGMTFSFTVEP